MDKKIAFSYIRMSTDAQIKGNSLQRQLEISRTYAKERGWHLVEDFCDIGFSAHDGTNLNKGKLGLFVKAVDAGEIKSGSVLIVESLDRLSRQAPLRAFNLFSRLLEHGIEIHSIFDNQVYTSESVQRDPGQLFVSIGGMLRAFSESEGKSKRGKKNWETKRKYMDTKILTAICPAWLRPNHARTGYEEIPDRADTIRKIYDLCINKNMGSFAIASYLNDNIDQFPRFTLAKKRNRGSTGNGQLTGWQPSYIKKILNSRAVYGEFQPHEKTNGICIPRGEIRSHHFPATVPKGQFLIAQKRQKERRLRGGGRKGVTFNNLFTKLIMCGNCGGTVHYKDKGDGPKGGKYLKCSNSVSRHNCNETSWRYDDFEAAFLSFVRDIQFSQVLNRGWGKSSKEKLEQEQACLIAEIRGYQLEIEKCLKIGDDLSDSALKAVRKNIERISNQMEQCEIKLRDIEEEIALTISRSSHTHDDMVAAIELVCAGLSQADLAQVRRKLHSEIAAVVERVEIDGLGKNDDFDDRSFTVIFKSGTHQTVFPYMTEEDELREIRFDETTARYEFTGERLSFQNTKFFGKKVIKDIENHGELITTV